MPGAVLVTGTDTCWEGAIVVRLESPLRSIIRSTTRVLLGEAALRFLGDGFLGEGGFLPGTDTPEGALLVRRGTRGGIVIRPMRERVGLGFSGLETSIPVTPGPLRALRALRFLGAGIPSMGAVRLGGCPVPRLPGGGGGGAPGAAVIGAFTRALA